MGRAVVITCSLQWTDLEGLHPSLMKMTPTPLILAALLDLRVQGSGLQDSRLKWQRSGVSIQLV
jgi:hypothetical protein